MDGAEVVENTVGRGAAVWGCSAWALAWGSHMLGRCSWSLVLYQKMSSLLMFYIQVDIYLGIYLYIYA